MNQTINQQLAEIRNNMLAITQNHKENEVNANQPQAGQTIQVKINPRGKGTMSAQVRKLMREQPQMSAQEIAKIVGCKPHTVHNVKYNQKKKRRASKVIQVKPRARIQREITNQPQTRIQREPMTNSYAIKAALTNFTMDLIASGNTDLLKNKHFQALVRLTTTSENTQL